MIFDLGKSISATFQNLFKQEVTDQTIHAAIKDIMRCLIQNNVSAKCVAQLKTNLDVKIKNESFKPGMNKAKWVKNAIFDELVNLVDPKCEPYKIRRGKSQSIVFVGLQGAGKTTTICKYANFYKKKGFKVGIVCADTFRAGAFDQIKQNALKISVPYFGSSDPDPVKVALEGTNKFRCDKFEIILIDTSGRHTQEKDLFDEMGEIISAVGPDNIVFVMDAGIGQAAEQQAVGFKKKVDFGSIILTKVDGAEKAGGAISSVAATMCPIEFIGNGEGMDDLDMFNPRRFINKILGKGDLEGLAEKIKDIKFDEKAMMKKIKSGAYTLRDFSVQLQQLMSLGPLSKIMEMIPGMGNLPISDEGIIRKMICIFDSMTEKELDSDGSTIKNEKTRAVRIAMGSGNKLEMVLQLISQFEMMSNLMKKLGNNQGFMNLLDADTSKMSISEKAKLKQQATGFLPKNILDQMDEYFK